LVDLTGGTGGTFFHYGNDRNEGFRKTTLPEVLYILRFSPQKPTADFTSGRSLWGDPKN
jgi:hypothetical protein